MDNSIPTLHGKNALPKEQLSVPWRVISQWLINLSYILVFSLSLEPANQQQQYRHISLCQFSVIKFRTVTIPSCLVTAQSLMGARCAPFLTIGKDTQGLIQQLFHLLNCSTQHHDALHHSCSLPTYHSLHCFTQKKNVFYQFYIVSERQSYTCEIQPS